MNKHGPLPATAHECLKELGFTEPATASQVKRKWRELTMIHHPDKGGDGELFNRVTHAYRFLTSPEYKAQYEADLVRKGHAPSADLDIVLVMNISFEDGFFGKAYVCTFNVQDFDENFIVRDHKSGELPTEAMTIQAGPGLFQEERMIIEGRGHRRGDARGKVMAVLRPKLHPRFAMEQLTISSRVSVPIDVLIRGGKIDVETMRGLKRVKVPAGSMPGDALMIDGVGVDLGNGKKLPHKVYLDPRYPTKAELKTKSSWRRFKIKWDDADPAPPAPRGVAVFVTAGGNKG